MKYVIVVLLVYALLAWLITPKEKTYTIQYTHSDGRVSVSDLKLKHVPHYGVEYLLVGVTNIKIISVK